MTAAALLTPFLVLGLLLVMARLEVWAQRPTAPVRRSRRKVPAMPSPTPSQIDPDVPQVPLLRDPPAPPGHVDPLQGSTAEDTEPSSTR